MKGSPESSEGLRANRLSWMGTGLKLGQRWSNPDGHIKVLSQKQKGLAESSQGLGTIRLSWLEAGVRLREGPKQDGQQGYTGSRGRQTQLAAGSKAE